MRPTLEDIIQHYQLAPHIEGGYYHRTYRSALHIPQTSLPKRFDGERTLSSTILYLIPAEVKSKLHRLKGDEIWHFYLGDPFHLVEILESGELKKTTLGNTSLYEQHVQYLVPHGGWFGGYVAPGGTYSFVGCTIFPGFDERDFELAEEEELLKTFPQHREMIIPFFS